MNRRRALPGLVALLVLALDFFGAFARTDDRILDAMLRKHGEDPRPPRSVAMVGVTDGCLKLMGQWPWKAGVHAELVEKLAANGATGILWDLPLPAVTSGDAESERLVAALKKAGNVILPVRTKDSPVTDVGHGRIACATVVEPDPLLSAAAAGLGHVELFPDPDSIVRGLEPVLIGPARSYAAMPLLALARRGLNEARAKAVTPEELAELLELSPDRGGSYRLAYYGAPGGPFETLAYSDVLGRGEETIGRSAFDGRMVLVGGAALRLHDQYPTPWGRMTRVEVLTTAVANGQTSRFRKGLPHWAVALWLVLAILIGTRLVARFGGWLGATIAAAALGGYAFLTWRAFLEGRVPPMTSVVVAVALAVVAPGAAAVFARAVRRWRARPWAAITGFTREGPLVDMARETLGASYSGISLLGAGGMAFVVKAVRASDNRPVAVKFLAPQLANSPIERERFEREVQLLAALPHPGIVGLLSWDLASLPHYTMELVVGVSLAETLRGGPLSLEAAAKAVVSLAETLGFAHAHHCVHRDVKPGNVLLDDQGAVKLIDFGAASRFDSALAGVGGEAGVAGTPDYMAPEALGTGAERVSPRLDVYSLGAMTYELLTGKLPWPRGMAPEVRAGHAIVPLDDHVSGVPPAVAAAVMAALEPDAARRPNSCAELMNALAPCIK